MNFIVKMYPKKKLHLGFAYHRVCLRKSHLKIYRDMAFKNHAHRRSLIINSRFAVKTGFTFDPNRIFLGLTALFIGNYIKIFKLNVVVCNTVDARKSNIPHYCSSSRGLNHFFDWK